MAECVTNSAGCDKPARFLGRAAYPKLGRRLSTPATYDAHDHSFRR